MKMYTKKGDSGKTQLLGGGQIDKDDPIVEAYGTVDELNSILGLVKIYSKDPEKIEQIQKDLFTIQTELSGGGSKWKTIGNSETAKLEEWIDKIEDEIPKLNHFILPGGTREASMLHIARTACRRAERRIVTASKKQEIRAEVLIYLNRLSDLLFVLARFSNYKNRVQDMEWRGKKLL